MATTMLTAKPFMSGSLVRPRVAASRAARVSVRVQAASRPLWLPGSTPPAHLKGELAGDFGFDPLGLGADPERLRWYVQAELVHCRFAMTAVAGILIPAILTKAGILNVPEWYDAGKVSIENSPIPYNTLLIIELILFHFVETKRYFDFKKPQSQGEPGSFFGLEGALKFSGENGYPGGPFDPLKLSESASGPKYKWNEVRNGRLAMLAFIGFCAQYVATGKGPLDNLADHVSNPALYNFTTNGVSLPF